MTNPIKLVAKGTPANDIPRNLTDAIKAAIYAFVDGKELTLEVVIGALEVAKTDIMKASEK